MIRGLQKETQVRTESFGGTQYHLLNHIRAHGHVGWKEGSSTLSCLQPALQLDPISDGAARVLILLVSAILFESSTFKTAEKISEILILSSLHI